MRVSLSIEEVSVIRNALATRHDDLRDLAHQWSSDKQMADSDQLSDARNEMEIVRALHAKLAS
jgi:hypothetical protein